jgi:hypothetical protein
MPALDLRPARNGPLRLDPVPEILRPLIRAYLLGYASAVAPRLLTLVLQHVAKRRRKAANQLSPDLDDSSFFKSAIHIVKTGFNPQRFPTFCAILAGGTTLLKVSRTSLYEPFHLVCWKQQLWLFHYCFLMLGCQVSLMKD